MTRSGRLRRQRRGIEIGTFTEGGVNIMRASKIHNLYSLFFAVVLTVSSPALSATFTVSPSGDLTGITDYVNIQNALDSATAAGAGSTVQLAAGTFYTNDTLHALNFSGSFKGSGKGVTILKNAPGTKIGLRRPPLEPYPNYLVFYQDESWNRDVVDNISVSDFTLRLTEKGEPWSSHVELPLHNLIYAIGVSGRYTSNTEVDDISLVNTTWERLEIIGEPAPSKNIGVGIMIFDGGNFELTDDNGDGVITIYWRHFQAITGTHEFLDVTFESPAYAGLWIGPQESSDIKINRVTVNNASQAISLQDFSNSHTEITELETNDAGGISIQVGRVAVSGWDFDPVPETMPSPSTYDIHHNTIRIPTNGCFAGVELRDFRSPSSTCVKTDRSFDFPQ